MKVEEVRYVRLLNAGSVSPAMKWSGENERVRVNDVTVEKSLYLKLLFLTPVAGNEKLVLVSPRVIVTLHVLFQLVAPAVGLVIAVL